MSKKSRELLRQEMKNCGYEINPICFCDLPHDKSERTQYFEERCKKYGGYTTLVFSDDEICDDKELVLIAKKYGFFSGYHLISEHLLNDPDIAIALADCNKDEYTNINKSLRENSELMLKAIKINPNIYRSLPVNVKLDRRIILEIANNSPYQLTYLKNVRKEAREQLSNDKNLAIIVAKQSPYCLNVLFSEDILRDSEIMEIAFSISNPKEFKKKIKNNEWALRYINPQYWVNDCKLVKSALSNDGSLLEILPENFQSNKEYVLIAVKNNPDALEFCSKKLLDDEDVIDNALQEYSEEVLSYASDRVKDIYDIVYKAVSIDALNLQYASPRLKDNRNIVLKAIKNFGGVLEDASERLRCDKELIKIAEENA